MKFDGDFDKIMENLMLAEVSDEDRYRAIINEMIDSHEVPAFDAFLKESPAKMRKRKRKAEKENKECEKASKAGEFADLALAIQQRQLQSGSFLDGLAAKYASAPKAKTSKRKK